MPVNDLTKLARSIQDSAIPRWLNEYIGKHKNRMRAELELFGEYDIPMPDGGSILIRNTKNKKEKNNGGL